jgi:cytochrome b561
MAARAFAAHKAMGMALMALVTLHVAASLYHHFIRKDDTLRRMLPAKS